MIRGKNIQTGVMMKLRQMAGVGVLALLMPAVTAHADWTLTNGDFAQQKGLTVNTWDVSDGLSVTTESGKLVKVESRNVLALTSSRPRPVTIGGGAPWKLSLRNGDVLYGEPTAVSGQSLEFKATDAGAVAVPLKLVATISIVKQGAAPESVGGPVTAPTAAADKDVVRLKNGDSLDGLIADVSAGKVQIAVGAADAPPTDVEMSRVDRLSFGGITQPRTLPPLSARITFASGSILTVPLDSRKKTFSWTINDVAFKDLAGVDRKVSAETISAIDVTGGRVVCLTEIDPAKDQQTTFMGSHWPTQVNRNVLGQPLKVARKEYPRGLGVHTRSHLLYDLDGSFEKLKFRVAMDDSAAPQGTADVSILLDGKVIWEEKGIKPMTTQGSEPKEIELPIKGGKQLELRADPALAGGKIDVLGRVDWLHVALVRP
jgi:hypothetical protein